MSTGKVVETLAESLGINPEEIRIEEPRWLNLMKSGVLVELHIRRWRAVTRLTADDLGIEYEDSSDQEIIEDLMKLGDKYLLPANLIKELNSIDTGARKNLEKYAFKTYWGYFLTAEAYQVWKEEDEKFQRRYYAVRDRIVSEYDGLRAKMLRDYEVAARTAYRRKKAIKTQLQAAAEDLFLDRFIGRIDAAMKSPSEIKESFDYEVDLKFVPLPSLLAEDEAEVEKIREDLSISRAAAEMRRDVIERAKRQKEELIGDFMRSVVTQINEALYDAATDVLETTGKNEGLHPRSVVQLQSVINKIRSMNFFDYEEVESMLAAAESELAKSPKDRKVETIESKLKDIATITRSTLIGLEFKPSRSGRKVGVSDRPTPVMVRDAKNRLGMVNVEIEPMSTGRKKRNVEAA